MCCGRLPAGGENFPPLDRQRAAALQRLFGNGSFPEGMGPPVALIDCRDASDVDGLALGRFGRFHQGLAQGGVGVDIAGDFPGGELEALGQGQLG